MSRIPILVLILVVLLAVSTSERPKPVVDVASRLEERLQEAQLAPGSYGIVVIERGAHPRVVLARGAAQPLVPASVAKLLTAATALDVLGPDHAFTTTLTARGAIDAEGTLQGDLVVHGTGDPGLSLVSEGGARTDPLAALATAVQEAGIRRVDGALVLDDGPFDRVYHHPTWGAADREVAHGAGVAGLLWNDGCVLLRVQGADSSGQPARVEPISLLGPWALDPLVETRTGVRTSVEAQWIEDRHVLSVRGAVAPERTEHLAMPVRDPLRFFGVALRARLEAERVRVRDGVRPARDAGDRSPGGQLVAQQRSELDTTLRVMNQQSRNAHAAILFKASGAAHEGLGSWASGERAVSHMLGQRGLDPSARSRIVDGSGLSLDNRTTAATVARLLVDFEADPLRGPVLRRSLAVPGQAGTLRWRLKGGDLPGRLRAKTGTIARSGVHALAGYLDGRRGAPGYAFAILLNTPDAGQPLIDDLVRVLGDA